MEKRIATTSLRAGLAMTEMPPAADERSIARIVQRSSQGTQFPRVRLAERTARPTGGIPPPPKLPRISEVVSKCALREKENDGTARFRAIPPRWFSRQISFSFIPRNPDRCSFLLLPHNQRIVFMTSRLAFPVLS